MISGSVFTKSKIEPSNEGSDSENESSDNNNNNNNNNKVRKFQLPLISERRKTWKPNHAGLYIFTYIYIIISDF